MDVPIFRDTSVIEVKPPVANEIIRICLEDNETCGMCGKDKSEVDGPMLILCTSDGRQVQMFCGVKCLSQAAANGVAKYEAAIQERTT